MSMALREEIVAAAVALLATHCAPAVVERNRRSLVDVEEAPHVNVLEGGHTASYVNQGSITYTMSLSIEGTATAATDDTLGTAMNAAYSSVVAALTTDVTLNGLCMDIRETALDVRIATDIESAKPLANFSVAVEIVYLVDDPAA